MNDRVCAAFMAVADLGYALGARDINKIPGCWEVQVDERWRIAVNAHDEELQSLTGARVLPGSVYVEYNGWPAGSFTAAGGIIAAGEGANEHTLVAALEAATAKANDASAADDHSLCGGGSGGADSLGAKDPPTAAAVSSRDEGGT